MENQTLPPDMILTDKTPVVQGMKVYRVGQHYDQTTRTHATVIFQEDVIWVNKTNRYFIVRCPKGCETKIKMADGCTVGDGKYYGTLASAEQRWKDYVAEQIKSRIDSIALWQIELAKLQSLTVPSPV